MTREQIYEELWAIFSPFERGLDMERRVALDGLIDAASRKLAAALAVEPRRLPTLDQMRAGLCELPLAVDAASADTRER